MKFLLSSCVALVLLGCASQHPLAGIGQVIQQAGDAAQATGSGTGQSGSVASGGTGYLPLACPGAQQPAAVARRDCH